jgi:hypothetical protein
MTNNILSFGSFITEAFDNPYRYTGGAGGPRSGTIKYKFFTSEKDEIEVTFEKLEWSDEEYTWMIAFDRDGRDNVTGEGDAMRIFATVLAILKDFTKKAQTSSDRILGIQVSRRSGEQKRQQERFP